MCEIFSLTLKEVHAGFRSYLFAKHQQFLGAKVSTHMVSTPVVWAERAAYKHFLEEPFSLIQCLQRHALAYPSIQDYSSSW